MQYFDHATDAATDPKIMQLRLECGGAAVDAYWYIIEQMHRDEKSICVEDARAMRVHCHTLCVDEETLKSWFSAMVSIGLFHIDENTGEGYSKRAMDNIGKFQEKRQKASSSAKSRWSNADAKQTDKRKQSKRNANAMLTKQNKTKDSSAIKSTTNLSVEGAAAAVETAPPSPPRCPLCESELFRNTQTGQWTCTGCCEVYAKDRFAA